MHFTRVCFSHHIALLALAGAGLLAQTEPEPPPNIRLRTHFETSLEKLPGTPLKEIKTKEEWLTKKDEYRRQLAEMLGLDPMPERTDLHATKTGEFEQDGVIIEKLHYQSKPGLYVTANLYRPKDVKGPLPAVLYMCGHSSNVKAGISYGNKAGYEHHGMWYAKHGFVCLMVDTVQLGEIQGVHHGTHRLGRWWWLSRGYTPAGVEAWAGIRGLDYLETRPEVDKTKMGVTGRSGGGAYSWWVAALDERIQCAAPTAGITDLHTHVVDGVVSGHCDCMYMVNTYGWDYDKVAALVAPRPLLIANTDKDTIFPIEGVFRIHQNVRHIYQLLEAEKNLGFHIAEGPHADVQPLNVGEFHWMTRFLQGAEAMSTFDSAAVKSIEMEKLKVFEELPKDEINTRIDESFVAKAETPALPENEAKWNQQRDAWLKALKEKSLRLKPAAQDYNNFNLNQHGTEIEGLRIRDMSTWSNKKMIAHDPGAFWIIHRDGLKLDQLDLVVLNILDEEGWKKFANTFGKHIGGEVADAATQYDEEAFEAETKMHKNFKWGMVYVPVFGVGPSAWQGDEKDNIQQLRRFYLLGQTLDEKRVADIRSVVKNLRSIGGLENTKFWLQASGDQAVNALYASLFEANIARLDLHEMPASHMDGPAYLNILKYMDVPQAVAVAAEKSRVIIYEADEAKWQYPVGVAEKLGWTKEKGQGLQLRDPSQKH